MIFRAANLRSAGSGRKAPHKDVERDTRCRNRYKHVSQRSFILLLSVILGLAPQTPAASPSTDPSASCDTAARRAAREHNVPLALLQAVTRVETGRGAPAQPWPWTINSGGQGYWFATRGEATDFARAEIAAGRTGFDLGCFQMNLRWHGQRFTSLEDMIDPNRNAQEAARFLIELHDLKGNWTAAAAAYHSQNPERARDYLLRVAEAIDQTPALGHALTTAPNAARGGQTTREPDRANTYPLLVSGGASAPGSIVPTGHAVRPLIGAE